MKNIISLLFFCLCSITSFANPPPAEDVFRLNITTVGAEGFALEWQIQPGFFLYKQRTQVLPQKDAPFSLGPLKFPPFENKTNKQGKVDAIYRNQFNLPIAVLGKVPGEGLLTVKYQGCSDAGFCYPPKKIELKLSIDKQLALVAVEESQSFTEENQAEPNNLDNLLNSHNLPLILLSFLGFGLLLSFTPCVLPMIPVLSGIIVGHGKNLTSRKAFLLSLSYVLSMSLSYAAVGAVVALLGANLQTLMQTDWIISLFSLIFVILALSMFDVYEFRLPLSWQNKIAGISRGGAGGHYFNAALMGCLSMLIISPCVTPPLIGALGYIAQTGNLLLGVTALFFLGLGMGTPLLLIGASAGKILPKAGRWMNEVKAFFGVLMLGMAIYLLSRIVPAALTMALWAGLCIFTGIYMGALTRSFSKMEKFNQGLGIVLLVYGLLILIGASQGKTNPLQPLASEITVESSFQSVETLAQAQHALQQARGKPVLLDFYADWCSSCKLIEATTLRAPQIIQKLEHFALIKVDLSKNNAQSRQLLQYFKVVAPPTFLFFSSAGLEMPSLRLVGENSEAVFLERLNAAEIH